jgi:tight adherence protein C
MSRPRGSVAGSVLIAILVVAARAFPALADDPFRIRITQLDVSNFPEVRLVASVVDPQDRPVADLTAKDLVVSEEGRTQAPEVLISSQNAPIAIALALDTSGSMAGRPLADAKAAMTTLVRSLGPLDSASVVTFNTQADVRLPLTGDKEALIAATNSAAAGGNTAIFDAVARSIDVLANAPPQSRRAIVLLTDGVDNSSLVSLRAVTERLQAQSYPLYAIGLGNDLDRGVLQALADGSKGGQAFVAPTSAELSKIYAALTQRILSQYTVTYRSDARSAPDGTELTVTVQIVRAGTILGSASTTFAVPAGHGVTATTPPPVATPTVATPAPQQAVEGPYSPELVALLGTATTLSLILWVFVLVSGNALAARQRRRLDGLVSVDARPTDERRKRAPFLRRVVLPALVGIAGPVGRIAGGFMSASIRRRLLHAGEPLDIGPAEFLGLQIGGGLLGAVVFGGVAAVTLGPQLGWVLLIGCGGLLAGIVVPSVWLDRTVKDRKHRIVLALPSVLDMLALSARAGMTFDGAVAQVAQRWKSPLTDEFGRMLSEFRMGRDRREALRDMASRTGVPEVARFANAIIQADALGVPISKVLRDQALEMRTRRRQRAEEAARKAPIKMLFPMVGLIFPALFVVILGPAVPKLLDIFKLTR